MIKLISKQATRTSRGILSKAWYEVDGEIVLVKGNTYGSFEPYSEVMASRISRLLGINYSVDYWLMDKDLFPEVKTYDIKHVSVCKSFIGTKQRFESLYESVLLSGKYDNVDWLEEAKKLFPKDYLYYLFLLDAVTGNDDRHLNNLGRIITPNNVFPSMIYDMGGSMLGCIPGDRIGILCERYRYDKAKPFRTTHKVQIKLFDVFPIIVPSIQEVLNAINPVLNLLPEKRQYCVKRFITWRLEEYVSKNYV